MTDVIQERIKSLEQRLATDPQSPLFARLASFYLKAGRASEALRLCDDGLALYPFYSTAHLVKGKALVELGMMAEAKHEYEVVHELLPTNDTLARLVSSIDAGSSLELGTAQAEEIVPEPEVVAALPLVEEVIVEEIVQQEPQSTEEPFIPSETVSVSEPLVEEPESVAPVKAAEVEEDSFGPQTYSAVETEPAPPSGYEVPGFAVEESPPPETSDTGFAAPVQEQPVASTDIEEVQAPAKDYGFGVAETPPAVEPVAEEIPVVPPTDKPAPSVATEDAFGMPLEAPQEPVVVEPTPAQEPPIAVAPPVVEPPPVPEQPAAPASIVAQPAATEPPPVTATDTPDWFEAFAQLQQPTSEAADVPPAAPVEEENPFAMFGAEQTPAEAESEPYENFAARVRMELFGTEDTVTLDDYLGTSSPAEPPIATNQIGELAEKLKSSPRMTPPVINYSEKAPRPSADGEASSGSGFVTPTLAEIYVKQGWLDDAIKAYRALAINKPAEKEKFEQRIAEIEEMKKKS